MNYQEITGVLQTLGMDRADAVRLVTTARNRNTRVSWVFLRSFTGIYVGVIGYIAIYFLFIYQMDNKDTIVFSAIYIPIMLIMGFLTPFFKTFFWSIKVICKLRGE